MIFGIFHKGSGLGNQLHRYIFTRVKALDLGVPFGMINAEGFKGKSFMNLDLGEPSEFGIKIEEPAGKVVPMYNPMVPPYDYFEEERINNEHGDDIRPYDKKTELIKDNTIVDGEFQAEQCWQHREKEIREWLKVEPLDMPKDTCVIAFRGGEFVGLPSLFLTKDYWDLAIAYKREKGVKTFEVHTDDPITAQRFFPDFKVIHDIGLNWRSIRYAHHLIVANSSFAIFPAWLNENVKEVIAPLFWARRNLGFWSMQQNKYKKWKYI